MMIWNFLQLFSFSFTDEYNIKSSDDSVFSFDWLDTVISWVKIVLLQFSGIYDLIIFFVALLLVWFIPVLFIICLLKRFEKWVEDYIDDDDREEMEYAKDGKKIIRMCREDREHFCNACLYISTCTQCTYFNNRWIYCGCCSIDDSSQLICCNKFEIYLSEVFDDIPLFIKTIIYDFLYIPILSSLIKVFVCTYTCTYETGSISESEAYPPLDAFTSISCNSAEHTVCFIFTWIGIAIFHVRTSFYTCKELETSDDISVNYRFQYIQQIGKFILTTLSTMFYFIPYVPLTGNLLVFICLLIIAIIVPARTVYSYEHSKLYITLYLVQTVTALMAIIAQIFPSTASLLSLLTFPVIPFFFIFGWNIDGTPSLKDQFQYYSISHLLLFSSNKIRLLVISSLLEGLEEVEYNERRKQWKVEREMRGKGNSNIIAKVKKLRERISSRNNIYKRIINLLLRNNASNFLLDFTRNYKITEQKIIFRREIEDKDDNSLDSSDDDFVCSFDDSEDEENKRCCFYYLYKICKTKRSETKRKHPWRKRDESLDLHSSFEMCFSEENVIVLIFLYVIYIYSLDCSFDNSIKSSLRDVLNDVMKVHSMKCWDKNILPMLSNTNTMNTLSWSFPNSYSLTPLIVSRVMEATATFDSRILTPDILMNILSPPGISTTFPAFTVFLCHWYLCKVEKDIFEYKRWWKNIINNLKNGENIVDYKITIVKLKWLLKSILILSLHSSSLVSREANFLVVFILYLVGLCQNHKKEDTKEVLIKSLKNDINEIVGLAEESFAFNNEYIEPLKENNISEEEHSMNLSFDYIKRFKTNKKELIVFNHPKLFRFCGNYLSFNSKKLNIEFINSPKKKEVKNDFLFDDDGSGNIEIADLFTEKMNKKYTFKENNIEINNNILETKNYYKRKAVNIINLDINVLNNIEDSFINKNLDDLDNNNRNKIAPRIYFKFFKHSKETLNNNNNSLFLSDLDSNNTYILEENGNETLNEELKKTDYLVTNLNEIELNNYYDDIINFDEVCFDDFTLYTSVLTDLSSDFLNIGLETENSEMYIESVLYISKHFEEELSLSAYEYKNTSGFIGGISRIINENTNIIYDPSFSSLEHCIFDIGRSFIGPRESSKRATFMMDLFGVHILGIEYCEEIPVMGTPFCAIVGDKINSWIKDVLPTLFIIQPLFFRFIMDEKNSKYSFSSVNDSSFLTLKKNFEETNVPLDKHWITECVHILTLLSTVFSAGWNYDAFFVYFREKSYAFSTGSNEDRYKIKGFLDIDEKDAWLLNEEKLDLNNFDSSSKGLYNDMLESDDDQEYFKKSIKSCESYSRDLLDESKGIIVKLPSPVEWKNQKDFFKEFNENSFSKFIKMINGKCNSTQRIKANDDDDDDDGDGGDDNNIQSDESQSDLDSTAVSDYKIYIDHSKKRKTRNSNKRTLRKKRIFDDLDSVDLESDDIGLADDDDDKTEENKGKKEEESNKKQVNNTSDILDNKKNEHSEYDIDLNDIFDDDDDGGGGGDDDDDDYDGSVGNPPERNNEKNSKSLFNDKSQNNLSKSKDYNSKSELDSDDEDIFSDESETESESEKTFFLEESDSDTSYDNTNLDQDLCYIFDSKIEKEYILSFDNNIIHELPVVRSYALLSLYFLLDRNKDDDYDSLGPSFFKLFFERMKNIPLGYALRCNVEMIYATSFYNMNYIKCEIEGEEDAIKLNPLFCFHCICALVLDVFDPNVLLSNEIRRSFVCNWLCNKKTIEFIGLFELEQKNIKNIKKYFKLDRENDGDSDSDSDSDSGGDSDSDDDLTFNSFDK